MYNETDLDKINLHMESPAEEPERQYYFMEKCREWIREYEKKSGRAPTACVTAFGCQMGTEPVKESVRII